MTSAPAAGAAAGDVPGLAGRVAARAIDAAILAVLGAGLGALIGFGYDWLAIAAILVVAYFAGLDTLAGATPGKRLLGLRVVGPGGERPTPGQAARREAFTVLGAVPFAGPLLALAAWVWILLAIRASPLGLGPHDRLAGGTRVVRAGPA